MRMYGCAHACLSICNLAIFLAGLLLYDSLNVLAFSWNWIRLVVVVFKMCRKYIINGPVQTLSLNL